MPRTRARRPLLVGLVVILAAAVAGTALASSISGLSTRNAGRGTGEVSGYTVSDVSYGTSEGQDPDVVSVSFLLKYTTDGTGASTVTDNNTNAWVQLLTTGTAGNWATCTIGTTPVAGTATCTLTGAQRRLLADVVEPSIVAQQK